MTPKKRSLLYQWECEMIDAFHDDRWKELLAPLYEKFQAWKVGALSADELNEALDKSYNDRRALYRLFFEKHEWLARVIPLNEEWYPTWMKDHPRPEGLQK